MDLGNNLIQPFQVKGFRLDVDLCGNKGTRTYQSSGTLGSQDVCFSFDERFIEGIDSTHLLRQLHAVVVDQKGMGFVNLGNILLENVPLRPIDFIFPFFERLGSFHNRSFQFSVILLLLLF